MASFEPGHLHIHREPLQPSDFGYDIKAKSGADRMKAATAKSAGGSGQVLKGIGAEEGAQAILKLLIEEGVVR